MSDTVVNKNSEFQVVSSKKKHRKKQLKGKYNPRDYNIRRIESIKEEFEGSEYYNQVLNSINKALAASSTQGIDQIVCYGIGNYTEDVAARYQFVLLLLLKQEFQCDVLIYDPVFTELELELIELFKLELISKNEECKHTIEIGKTLVYMPRCASQLVNNLLFSNWTKENLSSLILLSNSISSILEIDTYTYLELNLQVIFLTKEFLEEIPLVNNFKFTDIFNDLSLHYFLSSKLNSVKEEVWDLGSIEPNYSVCIYEAK